MRFIVTNCSKCNEGKDLKIIAGGSWGLEKRSWERMTFGCSNRDPPIAVAEVR